MANSRGVMGRVGTFVLAIFFLVTSVGFSLLVIWQIRKENKQNGDQAAISQALQDAQNNSTDDSSNKDVKSAKTEDKLEGTKLANFKPVASVGKLQIIDTKIGTGKEVKASDTITAHYTGALAKDGTIFQSSLDTGQPFSAPISNLIKGWQEGIPGMKEGGTRRLIIPAAEAYGAQSQPGIPANSDLVFDIQLIKIGQ